MNRCKNAWIVALVICLTSAIATAANLMSIQIKKGQLRNSPSFLGKIVAELNYAEKVAVLEKTEAWIKVRSSAKKVEGWLHSSALTFKKIILKPGAADVSQAASSSELALAGKGFSEQVEGEFKTKNPQLDYALINQMEQMVVSQNQIEQFLIDGKLSPKGGVK
ncbi:MAG: SH3 domain-containing protein [Desulfobacterales bacterium]|nr:SH3 domain-containing protein [Desulfobacterales bacterium]